tara:strand:+ start:1565 stop:1972 length:408 start_codon:yes stop_codon:yes gene_type:complete
MWTEDDVVMVEVDWLKPHEQIKSKARDKLLDMTKRWGGFTKPVLVDSVTGSLLDGHHRLSVAQELGLSKIPAICLDYLSSADITLELWPNTGFDSITKSMVIQMCESGDLFPPKTTKHTTIFDLPPILVSLDDLR